MSWLSELWDSLEPIRETVAGAQVQRKAFVMLPKERVKLDNDPFPEQVAGDKFIPGGNYFGLRLAGLNLTQARRFTKDMLPLCVCMAEFGRKGAERSVPFSIGPNTIRQKLKQAGITDAAGAEQAWIELRDLTIVRPTPVDRNNLSLFVGLYAVPGGDVVGTLLDVMGSLGSSLGVTATTPVVDTAKAVYGGLGKLLGLNDVTPHAEAMSGRALHNIGSGYVLVANAPDDVVQARDLHVDQGRLCDAAGRLVFDIDYCLIGIEHYATIIEMPTQTAPDYFADPAAAVQTAINEKDRNAFAPALQKLIARIQSSDDVIDADKDKLVQGYTAIFSSRWNQQADAGAIKLRSGSANGLAGKLSLRGAELKQGDPALAGALAAFSNRLKQKSGPAHDPNETSAQLWKAVRAESIAIATATTTKPPPGKLASTILHALN